MILIRRALPEENTQLTEITIAAKRHWNYPEKWMQVWLPALTISSEYILENEVWIAAVDDTPVAYYSLKQEGEDLWLDNLWVLPSYIGNGIGRELFQHALERSRARVMSILKIEADPNAQGFYERMGAHKVNERHTQVDGQLRILPLLEIDGF
jgi:GNAT superfamily N-acetyltransferase